MIRQINRTVLLDENDALRYQRDEARDLARRLALFVRAWDRCDEGIFEVRAAISAADLARAAAPDDGDGGEK